MASASVIRFPELPPLPVIDGMPIFYEDEEEGDMGESNPHVVSDVILFVCLKAHLANRPEYRVYSNMNCYYRKGPPHPRTGSLPYISPDIMVVHPERELGEDLKSYTIGTHGPAPVLVAEILSERSAQQRDLGDKVAIYARLEIAEYLLVDVTGRFMRERLLLKRLQDDRTWKDEKDADGGVTSRLGFRVKIDSDGRLRVLNAKTGREYVRPDEAESEAAARIQAEGRIRELEEELARLRKKKGKKGK